jgi:hypothetical protein
MSGIRKTTLTGLASILLALGANDCKAGFGRHEYREAPKINQHSEQFTIDDRTKCAVYELLTLLGIYTTVGIIQYSVKKEGEN